MSSFDSGSAREIRDWLFKEFDCYYCGMHCIVKDVLSKRGCFMHQKPIVYSHPLGYPARKALYWGCCPDKPIRSVGCLSCDHADGPHPNFDHIYYRDIPLTFIREGVISPDPVHTKKVTVYYESQTRSRLVDVQNDQKKPDISKSYVKIKRTY